MNTTTSIAKRDIRGNSGILAKMKKYKYLYILLLPALIYTVIFCYVPMAGVVIAFQDYDIIGGIWNSPFVGLQNFITVFSNPKMLNAIKNTLLYSGVNLFLGTPFPIILALLLNELKFDKFKRVTQTVSYLPHFLSWVSVVGIFSTIFATYGPFNDIMAKIFGSDYVRNNILMDSKNFLPVIFWTNIWKSIGWNSIIYLAAIAGIDQSMYEAAIVDGCNRFWRIIYITLPNIVPTIVILFILATGSLVNSNFEQVFGFQNIYTQEDTEVINTLIYRAGIQNAQYSLSTAFGVVQSLCSFLLVYVSNAVVKRLNGTGIW